MMITAALFALLLFLDYYDYDWNLTLKVYDFVNYVNYIRQTGARTHTHIFIFASVSDTGGGKRWDCCSPSVPFGNLTTTID